jgi:1-deoxy-D-xylulose-5-phosphate reductoisomerase
MKNICLLGASGSVGESTLKVLRQFPEKFKLHSFSVHSNLQKAKSIILEFYPKNLVVSGTNVDKNFLGKNFEGCNVLYGEEYLDEIVCHSEIHTVVTAIVGAIGIYPTLSAIRACKKIAIANKETLVTFGPYIQNLLKKFPSTLIPVDSEHNALFQLLEGKPKTSIRSLILTASGGPFREREISTLNEVTVEEALKHPTWKMGPKITIDSAGLINKSLEVIEAHFLFNLTYEQIEVVVHPESIVHGIVEFVDGSTTMYASHPDMVFPVAHSLFYPEFTPNILVERKPDSYPALHFFKPDTKRYPALNLAYQAGKKGGTAPAIFNAANEVAVELFLNKKIRFTQIPEKIDFALQMIPITFPEELDGFLEADSLARKLVMGE